MHLFPIIALILAWWTNLAHPAESLPPSCAMQPDYIEMQLPSRGFIWLSGQDFSGKCSEVPKQKWIRRSSGPVDTFVYAEGPSGSGRYWNLMLGVAPRNHSKPTRGVCLVTSTLGWRTLRKYHRSPLPWLDDLDNDGNAEFIIWNSFPLEEGASVAEYGLTAWVYRFTSKDTFAIDWALSRQMAREIAQAYRLSLDSTMPYLSSFRRAATEALEQFSGERCSVLQTDAR